MRRLTLLSGLQTAIVLWCAAPLLAGQPFAPRQAAGGRQGTAFPFSPFTAFTLPDDWESAYWADPAIRKLLSLPPDEVAALVPVQTGLKHCRCPACPATEAADPLRWSLLEPAILRCRACGATFPNDQIPAKVNGTVPEEVVDVKPGVVHRYPYHTLPPESQRFPEERLYLAAKRDAEIRDYLSKAALYAAVRYQEQAPEVRDPALARLAAVVILRFAQVYPGYATHFDQPGQPKFFQPASLDPPYRRGYQTGKWDDLGCLDVPLNLLLAYGILRHEGVFTEAGRLLGDPDPHTTIERDLFRASAEFVRRQTEEFSEASLYAYRGLLAVGRLLDDPELVHDAVHRLEGFAQRGFFHDGYWREGDPAAHRRIVGQIDGWIDRLLLGYRDPPGFRPKGGARFDGLEGASVVPQLVLARTAGAAALTDRRLDGELQKVSWPAPRPFELPRRPRLLGGAGLVRLALGSGPDAFDVELRGLGDFDHPRSNRLAVRVAVGGQTLLGDLDDEPPAPDGFDRASASHNTVIVDGRNHRETLDQARVPTPGSDLRFHAATSDFQVAALDDRYAYPESTSLYRQIVVASATGGSRYALSIFQVEGGRQHDQLFHAGSASDGPWHTALPLERGPDSLLPGSIPFVSNAPAEGGRWFMQSYGVFRDLRQGVLRQPGLAWLEPRSGASLRLHLLGSMPALLLSGISRPDAPDPRDPSRPAPGGGRAILLVRRTTDASAPLRSRYVTLIEPVAAAIPAILRVGQVESPGETVVVLAVLKQGPEHIVVNLQPGREIEVRLADGRTLATDGLAVRVRGNDLAFAGGTYATLEGLSSLTHDRLTGQILEARREASGSAWGAFCVSGPLSDPEHLPGQTLVIRHADGTSRGWTIDRAQVDEESRNWLFVREEPGFTIDPDRGEAVYYQFPRLRLPGPHQYVVARISGRAALEPPASAVP